VEEEKENCWQKKHQWRKKDNEGKLKQERTGKWTWGAGGLQRRRVSSAEEAGLFNRPKGDVGGGMGEKIGNERAAKKGYAFRLSTATYRPATKLRRGDRIDPQGEHTKRQENKKGTKSKKRESGVIRTKKKGYREEVKQEIGCGHRAKRPINRGEGGAGQKRPFLLIQPAKTARNTKFSKKRLRAKGGIFHGVALMGKNLP